MYSDQNYNRSCGNLNDKPQQGFIGNNYQNSNQNYNRNHHQASSQHGLNEDVVAPKPHHQEELRFVLFDKKKFI